MSKLKGIMAAFGIAAFAATGAMAQSAYPEAGRTLTMIVPFGAGGPTDAAARLLIPGIESALGVNVVVENLPGASTQIGVTRLSQAAPDGYTIGFVSLPQLITVYGDPDRGAVFNRESLQPLAMHVVDPIAVIVRADSPYQTFGELMDAVRANPGTVKGGTGGFMGTPHLAYLEIERATDTKFALVNFEGSAPGNTALLGGHIDVLIDTVAGAYARAASGEVRILAIADSERSAFAPDVPTLAESGVDVQFAASRGLVAPAGVSPEIVETLSAAIKGAIETEDHATRMRDMGQTLRYLDPAEFATYWETAEAQVEPLMERAREAAE